MRYNVLAQDANLNEVQLFNGIDENALDEFVHDYCETDTYVLDLNPPYRWLKDFELPEYDLPYCASGWIVRFVEAETP